MSALPCDLRLAHSYPQPGPNKDILLDGCMLCFCATCNASTWMKNMLVPHVEITYRPLGSLLSALVVFVWRMADGPCHKHWRSAWLLDLLRRITSACPTPDRSNAQVRKAKSDLGQQGQPMPPQR